MRFFFFFFKAVYTKVELRRKVRLAASELMRTSAEQISRHLERVKENRGFQQGLRPETRWGHFTLVLLPAENVNS